MSFVTFVSFVDYVVPSVSSASSAVKFRLRALRVVLLLLPFPRHQFTNNVVQSVLGPESR